MKNFSLVILLLFAVPFFGNAQETPKDSTENSSAKIYVITTQNGGIFIGSIISENSKEVLIKTKNLGEVSIPKYEIKERKELKAGDLTASGELKTTPIFATRYFLTTNGIPLDKKDGYYQLNLFGPEFHYGVSDNFSVGAMTSWMGIPIIGNAKYSFKIQENIHFGVGTLLGTGSWASPGFVMALPFGSLTIGNKRSNINFSGGYGTAGTAGYFSGTALISVSGMKQLSNKISFVFDSFIVPEVDYAGTIALVVPGLRFHTGENKAFQFGLAGIVVDGEVAPLPIPMLTWFRKL